MRDFQAKLLVISRETIRVKEMREGQLELLAL